jgi:hypothetical protein
VFYLVNQGRNDGIRTNAVNQASKSVQKAADKVGDAVDGATK